ncbi:MAG: FtsX-like permease family protein [Gemmatimonadota bacterium]|nr:FtsX-like permease family protein [Gemmatimonadota bacterium]
MTGTILPLRRARTLIVCNGFLLALAVAGPQARGAGVPQDAATPGVAGACPREEAGVLVERAFAARAGLSPGDRVRLAAAATGPGCAARIEGLFEPAADPATLTRERPLVRLRLPDLQRIAGRGDEVDRFSLRLAPGADPDATAAALQSLLPGTQVLPAATVAARASTTFEVVRRFHRAIGIITITAGGVFLACIMTLKVQERRAQVAALRLVGISRGTLVAWLMSEAALVAALGGVAGIGVGRLAASVINAVYRNAYDTTLAFAIVTRETVILGLLLAVGLGLAAGLVGALRLTAVDPLQEVGR